MKRIARKRILELLPEEAAYAEVFAVVKSDGKILAVVMWRRKPQGVTSGVAELDITEYADSIRVGDVVYRKETKHEDCEGLLHSTANRDGLWRAGDRKNNAGITA